MIYTDDPYDPEPARRERVASALGITVDEAARWLDDRPDDFRQLVDLQAALGDDSADRAIDVLVGLDELRKSLEAREVAAEPEAPATVDELAARVQRQHPDLDVFEAHELATIDEEIAELEAEATASVAPWLDTRELPEPPRPWSEDDWERDRRRAQAAGVALNHETWRSFAEDGIDAVWQLAQSRRETELAELRAWRARRLEELKEGAARRKIDRAVRNREIAKLRRALADHRAKHGGQASLRTMRVDDQLTDMAEVERRLADLVQANESEDVLRAWRR